jgi:hypothetical protein
VHQSAILCRHPQRFGGAERLLVEFDRGVGVIDHEMRRDGLHGVGHVSMLPEFVNHHSMTNGKV